MKAKKKILILCLIAVSIMLFSACEGLSAYDIAVKNGFEGTEQQWLHSLKGKDGLDGESLNVNKLYELYKAENPDATFTDFLNTFLTIEYKPLQDAANIAIMSSVAIVCEFGGTSFPATTSRSAGSGVIYRIDKDGFTYIITNFHVVYNNRTNNKVSNNISIYLIGSYGKENAIKAEYVGGSAENDIAVLRADSKYFNSPAIKAIEIADSNQLTVGEAAIAVGNPQAEGISVTSGIISVDSEYIEMDSITDGTKRVRQRVIRMDTSVNHGNSGGGLFNSSGKLIGIVNAKIVDQEVDNIGYAIPANVAVGIAKNIIETGGKRCMLGITTQPYNTRAVYDNKNKRIYLQEDVKVSQVSTNSLAHKVLKEGDVLLSAKLNDDGIDLPIMRGFYLPDLLLNARVGDKLYLTVQRAGQQLTVVVEFTKGCLVDLE